MGKRITTEDFILRSKNIHENKYDYSKTTYVNPDTPLIITCKRHGDFFQLPFNHLYGHGCPKCSVEKSHQNTRKTLDSFIQDAKRIHNDIYDYSKVNYINSKTKVEIVCKEHGSFWQVPNSHLRSRGCPECAKTARLNNKTHDTESFIKAAIDTHGNLYDYSLSNYVDCNHKILIKCYIHGVFAQTPGSHINGHGCPDCAKEIQEKAFSDYLKSKQKNTESIVKEFESLNRKGYSYKKVDYKRCDKPVIITCEKHGDFAITPSNFLRGYGCNICGRENAILNATHSKPEQKLCDMLKSLYGETNVLRNHKTDSYPFHCDFYIPSRDLYIEYNGFWMHGKEWYSPISDISSSRISKWNKCDSPQYKSALVTYTVRDVNKRQTAKKNKLNYVVLWNEKDIEDWFAIGCPDGQDWDHEYSWKDTKKEV